MRASDTERARGQEQLKGTLESWRRSLIDLSGRNRLLHFRETTSSLRIEEPSLDILLDGLERGWEFASLPDEEPEEGAVERPDRIQHGILTQKKTKPGLDRALRTLRAKSTQLFNDYGLWTLQLGVGMLNWREDGAMTTSRAPLILFPVQIDRTPDGRYRLVFNEDEEPKHNPAVKVKLEQLEVDWSAVLEFEPAWETVDEILAAAAESIARKPGWKIEADQAVVYMFASHKEAMYQDLRENEDKVLASELVQAIGSKDESGLAADRFDFSVIPSDQIDTVSPPEETPLVLDADSSQRQAVAAAMEGRSFVLDGPPGTGKSQTITNIIAALLYRGRRVLFVSEKAAALDVVLNRLASVGLDSYVLALHSHNTSRKAVAQELGRALLEEPNARHLSETEVAAARQAREDLGAYAEAMNEERLPLGCSLHDAIGRVGLLIERLDSYPRLSLGAGPDDDFDVDALSSEDLRFILDSTSAVAGEWDVVCAPAFVWRDLREQPAEALKFQGRAHAALRAVMADADKYKGFLSGDRTIIDESDMERILEFLRLVDARYPVPQYWLTVKEFGDRVDHQVDKFLRRLEALHSKIGSAAAAAGDRWENLPERLRPYPGESEKQLRSMHPIGIDPEQLTEERAEQLGRRFSRTADELDTAQRALDEIVERIGASVPVGVESVQAVCDLVTVAESEHRPLGEWLVPGGVTRVRGAAVRVLAQAIREFAAQRDLVVESRTAASEQVGPRWADLSPSLDPSPPQKEKALADLAPVGLSLGTMDRKRIADTATRFQEVIQRLELADDQGRSLAVQLGCPEPTNTEEAEALVALAESSRAEHRALPSWLVPGVLPRVQQAMEALTAAERDLHEAALAAQEWFTPELVNVDAVPDAVNRLEAAQGLFAVFASQVRADRKLIASLTPAGSWTRNLYEKLPLGLSWHQAQRALRSLMSEHTDLLGRYVADDHFDTTGLAQAIAHAELIHRSASGALADPATRELLAAQLCDGYMPPPRLLDQAAALGDSLRRWRADLTWHVLVGSATALTARPLTEAARWFRAHLEPLEQAATLMDTVTTVGGADPDRPVPPTLTVVRAALAQALDAQRRTAEFEAADPADRRVLQDWYRGLDTDMATLGVRDEQSGQCPADAAALLREAAEQARGAQGPAATDDDRALLGRYHDSLDTAALSAAVSNAHRVVGTGASAMNDADRRERLIIAFEDGRPVPAQLLEQAKHIREVLARWSGQLGEPELQRSAKILRSQSLSAVAQWYRAHVAPFWDAAETIRDVVRVRGGSAAPTLAQVRTTIEAVMRARTAQEHFYDSEEADSELLGELYEGIDTERARVLEALEWAREVRRPAKKGRSAPLPEEVAAEVLTTMPDPDVSSRFEQWNIELNRLQACFEPARARQLSQELRQSLQSADRLLSDLGSDQEGPHRWQRYAEALLDLQYFALGDVPRRFAAQGVPSTCFAEAMEYAILVDWIERRLADDPRLKPHRAVDRDQLVKRFQAADLQLVDAAHAKVIEVCNSKRPRSTVGGHAALIRREAEKKKRHMPVRRQLGQARDVVQRIKPCFMMSPLTVSQFLPPDFRFDVVIFDEASQVLPQDAVNSIYRGDALIVAGDEKQLPPTSFFSVTEDSDSDEWDENGTDTFESILKACKASGYFRNLPLRWHYRSRHENLIAFSNHEFYSSEMVTFPGALEESQDVGVEFFKADGIYDRSNKRDNIIEAELVAQRVVHHFRTRPGRSLGVVALSKAQAEAIENAVTRALGNHPELAEHITDDRLDGFFGKTSNPFRVTSVM